MEVRFQDERLDRLGFPDARLGQAGEEYNTVGKQTAELEKLVEEVVARLEARE